jgi:hypothetical protein
MTPPVPPVPAKKSNVLLWVLIGVGGFFFLIVVVVLAGGLFVAHKVREGHFEMKSADGTVQIGGDAKLPTWVPEYPGSKPQNAFSAQVRDGRSGTFMFKTRTRRIVSPSIIASNWKPRDSRLQRCRQFRLQPGHHGEGRHHQHTVTVVAGGRGNETRSTSRTRTNSDPFFGPRKEIADDGHRIGAGFEDLGR